MDPLSILSDRNCLLLLSNHSTCRRMDFQANQTSMNASSSVVSRPQLVSEDVSQWVDNVLALLILAFSVTGMTTNIVNARVFLFQGLRANAANISLFCISLADVVVCVSSFSNAICYVVRMAGEPLEFATCSMFSLVTAGVVHVTFFSISCWVTVAMSVEKSLCVVVPMKVKRVCTLKTTVGIITSLCGFFVVANVAMVSSVKLVRMTLPGYNVSAYVIDASPAYYEIQQIYGFYTTTVLNMVAFAIVLLSTIVMLYHLNQSRKWRQSAASACAAGKTKPISGNADAAAAATKSDTVSGSRNVRGQRNKDIELLKMVTIATSIFLVCLFIAQSFSVTTPLVVTSLDLYGADGNILGMMIMIRYTISTINASVNFFFYLHLSTRYRLTFNLLHPCCSSK